MGPKNAYVAIAVFRISDPKDYKAKAKEFLDRRSGEVGAALANAKLPDLSPLPRRVF